MRLLGIAVFVSLFFDVNGQKTEIAYLQPYKVFQEDTLLSDEFIRQLCLSIRTKADSQPGYPSYFEQLINLAAGTHYRFESQKLKVLAWWRKYSNQCHCESQGKKFPAGGLLRQIVYANFRDLANIIGPNGRLTLDLEIPDPMDNQTILQYVKQQRQMIEESYELDAKKFQRNSTWKNMTFFLMLFTEYEVQKAVNMQKDNQ